MRLRLPKLPINTRIGKFIVDTCFPIWKLADMENALRIWREQRALKLSEAADLIGVSPAMLSRWETGSRRIPAERVLDISTATGIPRQKLRPDLFAGMEAAE